jgi:hypothetical protein
MLHWASWLVGALPAFTGEPAVIHVASTAMIRQTARVSVVMNAPQGRGCSRFLRLNAFTRETNSHRCEAPIRRRISR